MSKLTATSGFEPAVLSYPLSLHIPSIYEYPTAIIIMAMISGQKI